MDKYNYPATLVWSKSTARAIWIKCANDDEAIKRATEIKKLTGCEAVIVWNIPTPKQALTKMAVV